MSQLQTHTVWFTRVERKIRPNPPAESAQLVWDGLQRAVSTRLEQLPSLTGPTTVQVSAKEGPGVPNKEKGWFVALTEVLQAAREEARALIEEGWVLIPNPDPDNEAYQTTETGHYGPSVAVVRTRARVGGETYEGRWDFDFETKRKG